MPDGFYDSKELINSVINSISKNIDATKFKNIKNIYDEWENILLSIKSTVLPEAGRKMFDHSEIIDIKDGVMLIEIDHPGWKQLFETYRTYILKGLNMKIPQVPVDTIIYRLKKGEVKIKPKTPETSEKKQVNKEEKIENISKNTKSKEIPSELKNLFNSIKESVENKQKYLEK
ncbi:MAG: DUF721 domain-containing protein [Spirochaetaceae bacterium]|nr:DUF721 domain-containing protein [Spirochaetaceae bacterium]